MSKVRKPTQHADTRRHVRGGVQRHHGPLLQRKHADGSERHEKKRREMGEVGERNTATHANALVARIRNVQAALVGGHRQVAGVVQLQHAFGLTAVSVAAAGPVRLDDCGLQTCAHNKRFPPKKSKKNTCDRVHKSAQTYRNVAQMTNRIQVAPRHTPHATQKT